MRRLKVLQLCHKPPFPPTDGGSLAMNNITQGLMRLGNQVTIITIFTQKHDIQDLPRKYQKQTRTTAVYVDTRINVVDAFSSIVTRDSYNINRFFSVDFDMVLARTLRKEHFDVIHLESLFMTPYIGTCQRLSNARIVLRSHNLEYIIWERMAGGTRGFVKRKYLDYLSKKLKEHELSVMQEIDGIASISEEDKKRYEDLGVTIPILNVPFGVDIESYEDTSESQTTNTFFHLGSMDWTPNLEGIKWFVENVWPLVLKDLPDAKLYLAGRKMPDDLFDEPVNSVEIVGEVDNAYDFMKNHGVMVVPLLSASGIRVKIIEGMALGRAVVSTKIGAEGITGEDGKHLRLANSAKEFARASIELGRSAELAKEIGSNARSLAESEFDNRVLVKRLNQFYSDLLDK